MRRNRGAASLALATGLALFLGGCSLILDFDKKENPADIDGAVSDAAPFVDGGDPCGAFESNDTLTAAVLIEPGTYSPLGICPGGDKDFFRFVLADNQDMVVEATFDNKNGAGDLEMRLYDNSTGMIIDGSMGVLDFERVERSLADSNQLPAGEYVVEVYGFNDTIENTYDLSLTVTSP